MIFIYYFYILLIYLCERAWRIEGSTDLSIAELRHLSSKLHPEQCIKLIESLYLRTPGYMLKDEKKEPQSPSSEDCQLKLEQWNHTFPGKKNKRARVHIIKILQTIGRVDLANYMKRSKRIAELLHNIKYLPRRYRKHLEELKKKRKKNKDIKINKKKFDKILNKARAVSPIVGRATGKDEDGGSSSSSSRWILIIIVFLLLVATIIATAAIIIYKSRGRTRDGMLNHVPGCDPRCKGYERLPKDIEDGWMSSMSDIPHSNWLKTGAVPDLSLCLTPDTSEPEKKKPEKKKPRKSSDKILLKSHDIKQLEKIVEKEKKVKKDKRKSLPDTDEFTDFEKCPTIDTQGVIKIMSESKMGTCVCCKCGLKPDGSVGEQCPCKDTSCPSRKTYDVLECIKNGIRPKINGRKLSLSKSKVKKNNKKQNKDKERSSLLSSPDTTARDESMTESPPTTKRNSKSKSPSPPPPPPPSPPPPPKEKKRESKIKEKSPKKEKPQKKDKTPRKNSSPKNTPKSPPQSPRKLSTEPCNNDTCSQNSSPRESAGVLATTPDTTPVTTSRGSYFQKKKKNK